jgi:hypothetical protein
MADHLTDPVLVALRERLREGRASMPHLSSEEAYAQQARSLAGVRPEAESPPESPGEQRAREKAASREQDARDLAEGKVTREELRQRRSAFVFPHMRVRLDLVKRFV